MSKFRTLLENFCRWIYFEKTISDKVMRLFKHVIVAKNAKEGTLQALIIQSGAENQTNQRVW